MTSPEAVSLRGLETCRSHDSRRADGHDCWSPEASYPSVIMPSGRDQSAAALAFRGDDVVVVQEPVEQADRGAVLGQGTATSSKGQCLDGQAAPTNRTALGCRWSRLPRRMARRRRCRRFRWAGRTVKLAPGSGSDRAPPPTSSPGQQRAEFRSLDKLTSDSGDNIFTRERCSGLASPSLRIRGWNAPSGAARARDTSRDGRAPYKIVAWDRGRCSPSLRRTLGADLESKFQETWIGDE